MAMFQQQLLELQLERQEIVGINEQPPLEKGAASEQKDGEQQHALFREQMEQLQIEREELFGFSHEEQTAWSSYGNQQQDTATNLIPRLEEARRKWQELRKQTPHSVDIEDDYDEYDDEDIDDQQQHTAANWKQLVQESRRLEQELRKQRPNSVDIEDDDDEYNDEDIDDDDIDDDDDDHDIYVTHMQADPSSLTHVSADGMSVHMVDVGEKVATRRVAVAQSKVTFPPNVMQALQVSNELIGPKGPILATAKVAGIMAAK